MTSNDEYYMEIPVVYPTILPPPPTNSSTSSGDDCDFYIVNDVDCTIRSIRNSADGNVPSQDPPKPHQRPIEYDTVSSAYGMTSVSEMSVEGGGSTTYPLRVVIATSPITDRIMAISRLALPGNTLHNPHHHTNHNHSTTTWDDGTVLPVLPKVIHVDFGAECQLLTQPIIMVQAFLVPNDESEATGTGTATTTAAKDSTIQVVVMDASANIITMRFHLLTLRPIDCTRGDGAGSTADGSNDRISSTLDTTGSRANESSLPHQIRCFSVSSKLNAGVNGNRNLNQNSYNHHIAKDMVSFCTMDIVVVAYNPYLLAIHLPQESMEFWSVTKCRQTMMRQEKLRQQQPTLSAISSLFTNFLAGTTSGSSAHSGTFEETDTNAGPEEQDRNQYIPVAAICSCSDRTTGSAATSNTTIHHYDDHQHVFTLHSDGIIRHWTMALSSSLSPISVCDITSRHVPNPSLWTADTLFHTGVSMHARVYDASRQHGNNSDDMLMPTSSATTDFKQYILIVQIQTSVPISYDAAVIPVLDDSQRPIPKESTMNLIAIDGMANRTITDILSSSSSVSNITVNTTDTSSSIRLTVPEISTDLIDMQLDTNDGNSMVVDPVLYIMFYSSITGTSIICSYLKTSTISILSKEPMIWSDNDPTQTLYMDSMVRNELDRIDQLQYYTTYIQDKMENSDTTTPTDILYAIDQRYMQYLFRPMYPRGNGTVFPPHPLHIYRAMQVMFPSTTIEPHHIRHGVTTSGTTATNCPNIETDVYDFIQEWRQRDRRFSNSSLLVPRRQQKSSTHNAAEVCDPNQNDDMEKIQTKERFLKEDERWRLFLHQILQQEQVDHLPLSIHFFPARMDHAKSNENGHECIGKSDRALIVRPGYISVLACNGNDQDKKRKASALDQLCYSLLGDSEYVAYIRAFDIQMDETIINNVLDVANVIDRKFRSMDSHARLIQNVKDISAADHESISHDLTAKLTDSFPWYCSNISGLGCVPMDMERIISIDPHKQPTNRSLMDSHTRVAAAALLVRSLDTIRHLVFTHFFVLSNMDVGNDNAKNALFHMYLHTTAVMYVAARMVPSSAITKHIDMSITQLPLNDQPRHRRSIVSSILDVRGISQETISLDPLILHISRKLPRDMSTQSFCTTTMVLAQLGIQLCLSRCRQISSSSQLPELDMLVMTSDEIESPALALRLLSVRDAIQIENDEQAASRKLLIAVCLINMSRCHKSKTEATNMVKRALSILPFDATNPDVSIDNLRLLTSQIGDDHVVGRAILVDHVRVAIAEIIDDKKLEWNPEINSLLTRLYTALFNVSVSMEKWDDAYDAFTYFTTYKIRIEKFHRLVRSMVNAGALSHLLTLIQTKTNDSVDDFYELAVDALSAMSSHDIYTSSVVDATMPTDYVGALYAIHASQGQWKRAAQSMDSRYVNARAALREPVIGLSTMHNSKREQVIIDDMLLGALGCLYTMEKIPDPNSRHLLSRENNTSTIYLSMNEIALRGKRCQVLKKLYDDKLGDPSFAVRAFVADNVAPSISDNDIVDQLFMQGFITSGIELAVCMDKATDGKPQGCLVLFDVLRHLVRNILLPLALDRRHIAKRPTIHQLHAAIDYTKGPNQTLNTSCVAHRSTIYSDLEQGPIRTGAMLLVEILTVKYTTDELPLASEVAYDMLSAHRRHTQLPVWLEQLLLTGTNSCDLPGLFSRSRKPGVEGYLGNPTVLLDIYTARGMVKDACRVVTRVFTDFISNRGHLAASRLPEKGEIDFIPFDKIKLLWCLVDIRLEKIRLDSSRRDLESARLKMKESMDEYFKLMKITEMGQQSARAL